MKRPVLFVLLSALAFAASAQSASPQVEQQQTATDQSTADQSRLEQKADAKTHPLSDRNCLRQTGSRIVSRDAKGEGCANATGRSYTREELERTGSRDLAQSLRMLDTAIR